MMRVIYRNVKNIGKAKLSLITRLRLSFKAWQKRWSVAMEKRCANFTPQNWKVAFAVFVAVSLSVSIWNMVRTFLPTSATKQDIAHINAVSPVDNDFPKSPADSITEARVKRFDLYLEKLVSTPEGKLKFDSIVKARPGLLDSLNSLKSINKLNFLEDENTND